VFAVTDWATDYDVMDRDYVADPFPIWDELRHTCPVAHSERYGGSWLPTRYEDVTAIAHDIELFSSRQVAVIPVGPGYDPGVPDANLPAGLPPISADPPEHTWSRRLLLPWFSHRKVAEYELLTRDLCRSLVDGLVALGHGDGAGDYRAADPGASHRRGARRPDRRGGHIHRLGA
jgi:cytochrome P450